MFGFTYANPVEEVVRVLVNTKPSGIITLKSDATLYSTSNVTTEHIQIYSNGEISQSLGDPTTAVGIELLTAVESSELGAGLRLFGGNVYVKVLTNGTAWTLKFELYKKLISDVDKNIEVTASVTFSMTFDWIPNLPESEYPPKFEDRYAVDYRVILENMRYVRNTLAILAGLGLSVIVFGPGAPVAVITSCVTSLPILAQISKA